ncbi:TetM/TetW/TetO/TetS family tetracycline resistance ribosomal protection protein [Ligilactobacillus saerimneri]|uniref:GTP-binding protein n=1 Tax=Ligilactobacillus saerimneri TaxID=228229 RepID=UPI0022A7B400|nr:TetM/TetW/TetO/TetS family tetracycline resistance ribosomal protection protein [Ligilactobacillus saerimneri]MDY4003926.1 translation factor GTPase family protein [Ligilactobacillus saerimneri]
MKKMTLGIVAPVDAGKTTLAETLLHQGGTLRQLGRVDHGDAFLDSANMEKQRGITIFSHQALISMDDRQLTLLDTPGHIDFAAAMEQVLSVLDYAVLVVAATDGVTAYTRTLWRLLTRYQVPTVVFVNKMDLANALDREALLADLTTNLASTCIPFDDELTADTQEAIALNDEDLLDEYLTSGTLAQERVQELIAQRRLFPVYFGSALQESGSATLLDGLVKWGKWQDGIHSSTAPLAGRVFKITRTEAGERLTWIKLTQGELRVKDELFPGQKINQIRIYNGEKYTNVTAVGPQQPCAVTGLTASYGGQGLGTTPDLAQPYLVPALSYAVDLQGNDPHVCLQALRQLEDENRQLHVQWLQDVQEIHLQVMGEMQIAVLKEVLQDRFGLAVAFIAGQVLYKETITAPVEGVGHFEPLRHYAEAHILLEPLPAGRGIEVKSDCSLEVLERNIQHQVLTTLKTKEHRGTLIGAPLTDVRLTLVTGRSHIKHTEGGDFREATSRAVRQGLMVLRQRQAMQLLEPWYEYTLMVPVNQVGRALNDIEAMGGNYQLPESANQEVSVITGMAPVSQMRSYVQTVRAYTHGQGQLECIVAGYRPAVNAEKVIAERAYEPQADLDNTPDSVFCAHGAGFPVPWDEVPQMMHVDRSVNILG